MATLGDTAARGAGVVLGTQLARVGLQFASMVVLARLLTPEDFGLVAMVTAVIGIAEMIKDFGLSTAAVQAQDLTDGERTNLFWANLGLGTAAGLAAAAAGPLIVAGYHEPRLGPIVWALSGVFVISGANTQYRSDLMRRMRYRQLATSDIVSQLVAILVAAALAVGGAGLWALVAQQITLAVVALVMNVISVRWLPSWPHRDVPLRRFFRFGGGVLGTHLLAYLMRSVAAMAIGARLGATSLGYYNRAYQLLMTPLQQIDAPMTAVVLPTLSRVADDEEAFPRYVARVQLLACYGTGVLLAVAAGLATPLTLVMFGERWLPVAPVFAVLAMGGVFRTLGTVSYWIFLAKGLTGPQLRQDMLARPVMIVIMLAGLPWGLIGVAYGHLVAFFLYWVVAYLNVGRRTGVAVRPLFVTASRAVLLVSAPAGVAAAAVTGRLELPALIELVLGGLAGLAVIAAVAALVRPVRRDLVGVLAVGRRALRRG